MILYNKSGLFLGMGNSELNLLGFEDMDEFRNYHNDIADLFVNKPGYIFKFHNFSWIEYALHSGTPNKRILIKTKNGKEVDISLNIHEIFLLEERDGLKQYFAIELTNSPSKIANVSLKNLDKPSLGPLANPSFTEEVLDDTFDTTVTFQEEEVPTPLFQTHEALFSTQVFHTPFEPEEKEENPEETIMPAFVQDVAPVAIMPSSVLLEEDEDATFSLKIEEPQEPIIESLLSFDETPPVRTFDMIESAENLGLDIGTFAELLDDYTKDLDIRMNEIAKAITTGDNTLALEHLSHLQSVAHRLDVPELIEHFEYLEESLRHHDEELKLHTLLLTENIIADFKCSLQ